MQDEEGFWLTWSGRWYTLGNVDQAATEGAARRRRRRWEVEVEVEEEVVVMVWRGAKANTCNGARRIVSGKNATYRSEA
jgi:hypothetical protein